jgi:hypothetical protein
LQQAGDGDFGPSAELLPVHFSAPAVLTRADRRAPPGGGPHLPEVP